MFSQVSARSRRNRIALLLAAALCFPVAGSLAAAPASSPRPDTLAELGPHATGFEVFEFRRYSVKAGERQHFVQYFDTWFPDAFQQLGAIAAGSFLERGNETGFTWIRGFHTMDDRAVANASFYYGPVWREHSRTLNGLMTDSDNVLLLRSLSPERNILILPAVDPVNEPNGAHGVIVAEVFAVNKDGVEAFAKEAEPLFARYRAAGAREAGVLVTLDVKNNFPQLPVRTDGEYLVWLGILPDSQTLKEKFIPVTEQVAGTFAASALLRSRPDLIVLDPTPRSRMRWLPSWK